jgi:hypothetical protein
MPHRTRRAAIAKQASRLIEAIRKGDDAAIQEMVMDLSKQHRLLAPLAFVVGAFAMLFEGVKLLVTNWRLTLVQVLPAMWIWAAMIDLKAHVLHGKSFHVIRGPILIPIIVAIVAITAFSFFLNAVFAFAISRSGRPETRPLSRVLDGHCRQVGTLVVRGGSQHRGGRHDGVLRGDSVSADWNENNLFTTRQTHGDRGGRCVGSGGLFPSVPARANRPPAAGISHPLHSGSDPPIRGIDPAGGGHQRGQDNQDECQTRGRPKSRLPDDFGSVDTDLTPRLAGCPDALIAA